MQALRPHTEATWLQKGRPARRLAEVHLHTAPPNRVLVRQSNTGVGVVEGEARSRAPEPAAGKSGDAWTARGLAALAAAVLCTAVALGAPGRAAAKEIDIYFGTGNFFHLQHEFVVKETLALSRRAGDVTSVTGYAGGKGVGDLDRVCYSSFAGSPDYKQLGHTQVVRVTVPDADVPEFARLFFDEVPKRKVLEKGPEYRSVIGLRGGLKSSFFPLIEEANQGRYSFVEGVGNDPSTTDSKTIFVYDTKKFPYRPAETVNQFANDPPDIFESDYRELNDVLKGIGSIFSTGCPEVRI